MVRFMVVASNITRRHCFTAIFLFFILFCLFIPLFNNTPLLQCLFLPLLPIISPIYPLKSTVLLFSLERKTGLPKIISKHGIRGIKLGIYPLIKERRGNPPGENSSHGWARVRDTSTLTVLSPTKVPI